MYRRRSAQLSLLLMAVVGLLCLSATQTEAAAVVMTVGELSAQSSDIVAAEVISTEARWNEDRTFIFTDVILRVSELHKGTLAVPSTVSLMIPGGEMGEKGLRVEHAPEFTVGQRVVVFLTPLENSQYGVVGWEQGKYTIENGEVRETGKKLPVFIDEIQEALK